MRHAIDPLGELNFSGFQEILNFTATGSESSVSVPVDGDTDKEYIVEIFNNGTQTIRLYLNNDQTNGHYGYQYIFNSSGTLSGSRATSDRIITAVANSLITGILKTPEGFLKTGEFKDVRYSSGTTIGGYAEWGTVWNYTTNVDTLDFVNASGNFTAGTTIKAYARRSA